MQGTVNGLQFQRIWLHLRDDGPDVFVIYSRIAVMVSRTLQEGDPVEFEIVQGPKRSPSGPTVSKACG